MVLSGRQVDFGPKGAQAGAMGNFRRLKSPALGFHEFFERHAGDPEVLADIGDFGGVRLEALHRHGRALHDEGFRDDKCVSVVPAFQQLAALDCLLEMRYGENARNKSTLFGRWSGEDFRVGICPLPSGIFRAIIDFI